MGTADDNAGRSERRVMTAALNLGDLFSRPPDVQPNALFEAREQWAVPLKAMRLWKRGHVRYSGGCVMCSEDDLPAIRKGFQLVPRAGSKRAANVAGEFTIIWGQDYGR